jgi:hypothetical protein
LTVPGAEQHNAKPTNEQTTQTNKKQFEEREMKIKEIHVHRTIRNRNPSKRAAADPRLRPRGRWDEMEVVAGGRPRMLLICCFVLL